MNRYEVRAAGETAYLGTGVEWALPKCASRIASRELARWDGRLAKARKSSRFEDRGKVEKRRRRRRRRRANRKSNARGLRRERRGQESTEAEFKRRSIGQFGLAA